MRSEWLKEQCDKVDRDGKRWCRVSTETNDLVFFDWDAREQALLEELGRARDVPNTVTRVEVIDDKGRSYVKYGVEKCFLSYQDDERTLKIFVNWGDTKLTNL